MEFSQETLQTLSALPPEKILAWAFDRFGKNVAFASSFQSEESVLIDMAYALQGPNFRVFTLDTGRLNEETYRVMDDMRFKYKISIESVFPERESVEKLVQEKGPFSFYDSVENRKECCNIRKVLGLNRKLSTLKAWTTGLRSEQSSTRAKLQKLEPNKPQPGILKINPLADWSNDQVWEYIRSHNVPYNKLYDKGYTSIGCAPCTRAISAGQDLRAGRWWWENPDTKECGLHLPQK